MRSALDHRSRRWPRWARAAGTCRGRATCRILPRSSAAAISRPPPIAAAATPCRAAISRSPADGRSRRRSARLAAPNITPDRETGIGAWTDDQFDAAVRRGLSRNGARLYPAMPFPYYTPDVAGGREGHPRLSQHHRARAQCRQGQPAAVSVQYPRVDDGLGRALFHAGRIPSRRVEIRRNGIAAPIWCRAPAIAAPAIRRRRCWEATRPPKRCRAMRCRAGPRLTSPAGRARCATGRPRTSRPISRPATTGVPRPPD